MTTRRWHVANIKTAFPDRLRAGASQQLRDFWLPFQLTHEFFFFGEGSLLSCVCCFLFIPGTGSAASCPLVGEYDWAVSMNRIYKRLSYRRGIWSNKEHDGPCSPVKGPLKYLVATLHGCYPNAISLPVSQNIFARFFRRRPVADSSRSWLFFLLRCNKHKKNF